MATKMLTEEAMKLLDANVQQITLLVKQSRELAEKYDLDFSLENLDLYTTDEMYDRGWNSSNC